MSRRQVAKATKSRQKRFSKLKRHTALTEFADLIRAGYAAFDRGDTDFLVAHSDPEIEVVEPPDLPDAKTHRGHAGLIQSLRNKGGACHVERLIDAGRECVIVVVRGSSNGAPEEVHLHIGRDGKAIRWEIFHTLDDAFAAIGLRKLKGER